MSTKFGLAQGLQMAAAIQGIKGQFKQQAYDKEFKTNLAGLQQDPNYKPQGEDYDPKAWEAARVSFLDGKLKDQAVAKGVFEQQKNQIESQYANVMQNIGQAAAAKEMGDINGEISGFERAYESAFDGNDLVIGDDRKSYELVNKLTGQKQKLEFADTESMLKNMRQTSDQLGQSDSFRAASMQARIKMAADNLREEWQPLSKRGAYTKKRYNNSTGTIDRIYEDHGVEISAEEARKRGLVTPEIEKTFAETELSRAKAVHERAAAKGEGKSKSGEMAPEGKLAQLYKSVYNVSDEEAVDMVRTDKSKGNIAKDIASYIDREMPDMDNPEDMTALKEERNRLIELYKPTQPSTRAKGLPKAPAAAPRLSKADSEAVKHIPVASKNAKLTKDIVRQFLKAAGGDRNKARNLAKAKGYKF